MLERWMEEGIYDPVKPRETKVVGRGASYPILPLSAGDVDYW